MFMVHVEEMCSYPHTLVAFPVQLTYYLRNLDMPSDLISGKKVLKRVKAKTAKPNTQCKIYFKGWVAGKKFLGQKCCSVWLVIATLVPKIIVTDSRHLFFCRHLL